MLDANDLYQFARLEVFGGFKVDHRPTFNPDAPWEWTVEISLHDPGEVVTSKSNQSLASAIHSLFTTVEFIEKRREQEVAAYLKSKAHWRGN